MYFLNIYRYHLSRLNTKEEALTMLNLKANKKLIQHVHTKQESLILKDLHNLASATNPKQDIETLVETIKNDKGTRIIIQYNVHGNKP